MGEDRGFDLEYEMIGVLYLYLLHDHFAINVFHSICFSNRSSRSNNSSYSSSTVSLNDNSHIQRSPGWAYLEPRTLYPIWVLVRLVYNLYIDLMFGIACPCKRTYPRMFYYSTFMSHLRWLQNYCFNYPIFVLLYCVLCFIGGAWVIPPLVIRHPSAVLRAVVLSQSLPPLPRLIKSE